MVERDLGEKMLKTVLNDQKHIDKVESFVYKTCVSKNIESEYIVMIYEMVGRLQEVYPNISKVDSSSLLWEHKVFEDFRKKIKEQDGFQTTPLEIEEGVLECYSCGSKKTISFQKQIRSADEGSTTFAQCVKCGKKWRHNN